MPVTSLHFSVLIKFFRDRQSGSGVESIKIIKLVWVFGKLRIKVLSALQAILQFSRRDEPEVDRGCYLVARSKHLQ